MHYLDPVDLSQLENLPVRARVIVEGALSGLHRARQHGSSVEFAQHKEYSAGDEIRHIDWKVFAKADRYYVKQFEQESELSVYLVLDGSGSMSYRGDGISKLLYASYCLAALAYLLIKQRDRVGLLVFGDERREIYVPPRGRATHLHDLMNVIESVKESDTDCQESLSSALVRIAELTRRRRSMIVVASDLFDDPESLSSLKRLRAQGHDLCVLHTLDRHELELPFEGMTRFEALEGEEFLLTNADAIRREYKERLSTFLSACKDSCQNAGVEYYQIATDTPVEKTLQKILASRIDGASTRRSWNS